VPNVKITATQEGTNLTRFTVSADTGDYVLPSLPVGTYTVGAEASGFKTASSSDITLDVNQQREVNIRLALPGTITKVEVSSAPPLLTTENATLGGLVTAQQVSVLPLNGRDITELVMLQPGVNMEVNATLGLTSNPSGNSFVASNGNRGTTGASFLDGLETSDNEFGGAQMTNFNLDAIEEFKVLQNDYSAEYGRGAGMIIQLVSKSGTDALHGSAFEYVRNSIFDARNFFATAVPPFRRNEFGGTVGGPIVLPGVYNGKDRTFFFFQYAGFRQRLGEPVLIPVPTVQERKGIVNIAGANGEPDQLIVPLNSNAQTVLNSYPLPNQPNGPLGSRTFNFEQSLPQTTNQWSARVDHRFSDKDFFFIRATRDTNQLPQADPVATIERKDFSDGVVNGQYNYGLTETHVFSPTLLHSFRFAYTDHTFPVTEQNNSITQSAFTDGSLATWGPDTSEWGEANEAFVFNDSVTWTKGRNTINAGLDYRRIRANSYSASVGGVNGVYNFEPGQAIPVAVPSASGLNNLAAGSTSPSSLISFMLGAPTTYLQSVIFPGWPTDHGPMSPEAFRHYNVAGWIQDDLRVSRKLTLNLGFRYEYNSVPIETAGRTMGIVDDPKLEGGGVFRKFVINPVPMWHEDYHGFGPRFGMAAKLSEKTVLRGGFAVFTNVPLSQTDEQQPFGAVPGATENPVFSLTPRSLATAPTLTTLSGNPLLPPDGDTHKIPPNTPLNLLPIENYLGGPLLVNVTDMGYHNGYTMAGNLTLERQLPGDLALQVGYVTNNAVGLYASEYPNAYVGAEAQFTPYSVADPGLREFQLTDNHAHSTYNSLQAMLRRVAPTHGIQFQVSYTYSKAIDNASTTLNGPGQDSDIVQNDPFCWRCEKGGSSFDFPQRLVGNLTYTLPIDKWQAISFVPRRLAEGWQITSVIQGQSGLPFTVSSPFGTAEYGIEEYWGVQGTRPDLVQQPTRRTGPSPEQQFWSNAVVSDGANLGQEFFATPGALTTGVQDHPGNLGRNTFRTHGFSNVDFSVLKDTKITERVTLQFRGEFFNLFNQHAFNIPSPLLSSPAFGVASSTVLPERQVQFALKLLF